MPACSAGAPVGACLLALIAGMRASRRVKIIPVSSGLFQRGLERMAERTDKDWSLTDCISFVVMEDEGLTELLTGGRYFDQGVAVLLA